MVDGWKGKAGRCGGGGGREKGVKYLRPAGQVEVQVGHDWVPSRYSVAQARTYYLGGWVADRVRGTYLARYLWPLAPKVLNPLQQPVEGRQKVVGGPKPRQQASGDEQAGA